MHMLLTASGNANTGADGILALTVLITGMVVVFLMLIFLTLIIKLYGNIVYSGTNKEKKKPAEPAKAVSPAPAAPKTAAPAPSIPAEPGIPAEVVAAIAAAVYYTEGVPASAVRSIRRSRKAAGSGRSAWGLAGVLEETRPF